MNGKASMIVALGCLGAALAGAQDRALDQSALIALAGACWTQAEAEELIQKAKREAPASLPLVTGIVRHNLAVSDPGRWVQASLSILKPLASRKEPMALAYYGSALTLYASILAKNGAGADAAIELGEGAQDLDEAVRLAPDSLALRFLRAENSVSVSAKSPLKRWDVAAEDLALLEKSRARLSAGERASVELLKARVALGKGDASEAMRRCEAAIRAAPESRAAAAARRILKDFEE